MFNLSGSELVFILLLALVVLGPEKLPDAMRRFGKTVAELRRMGSSFQDEFRSTMDEPIRELKDTADLLRRNADFSSVAPDRAEKPKSPSAMSVDIEADRLDGRRRHDPVDDELDDDLDDDELDDDELDDELDEDELDDDVEDADDDFGHVPARSAATDDFGAVPQYPAPTDGETTNEDAERSA